MLSYSTVTCGRSIGVDSPSVWYAYGELVPFLDMLNHDDEATQVEWECNDSDSVIIHLPSKKKCISTVIKDPLTTSALLCGAALIACGILPMM